MTRRLGWLGPTIVAVGAAVACVGAWYFIHARPTAGAVIDTIAIDDQHALVIRGETGSGGRAFVELREGDDVKWQALVPQYAGRPGVPGVAWSATAVSVRVIRDGHAEIFALAAHDASKLGTLRLAPEHPEPVVVDAPGPITLTDHARSYELVTGPGWHQLVAIDLQSGKGVWSRELGPAAIRAGGLTGGLLWIEQDGRPAPRLLRAQTGADGDASDAKTFADASTRR
jgi:hypothetical protein